MPHTPGSVVPTRPAAHKKAAQRPTTLVWIDSREAHVVRWHEGSAKVARLVSDVPAHRHATGHDCIELEPAIEGRRLEHLNRFVSTVAQRVPAEDDVIVVGPGTVRERLARELADADAKAHHTRRLATRASAPLTEPQLVALLRKEIGEPAPRKAQKPRHSADHAARHTERITSSELLQELDETLED